VLLVAMIVATASCYDSDSPLGPPEGGEIDSGLVGEWQCRPADPKVEGKATLSIRAFDERQYYVEWRDGEDLSRYRAYSTQVGDVVLVNLEDLSAKLSSPDWVFVRYGLKEKGRLALSIVREDALAGLDGKSARDTIRKRVKDEALYQAFADCGESK
jgi:hypothetical protein